MPITIQDVENMDADAIKADKAKLAEAVKDDPALAVRYVQARLDAKVRDRKLKEQGKTITALQDGTAALKREIADLTKKLEAQEQAEQDSLNKAFDTIKRLEQARQADGEVAADQAKKIRGLVAQYQRLKAVAAQHHAAVIKAAGILNGTISAQAIEAAEETN